MTKMIKATRRFPSLFSSDEFDDFFNDFDSLMDNVFSGLVSGKPKINIDSLSDEVEGWQQSFSGFPRGDSFVDKGGNMIIELALAGYSKDQLKIEAKNGQLVISAKKCEKEKDERRRSLSRRAFYKTFSDPAQQWDLELCSAIYEDGLLKVVIPPSKKEEKSSKIIDIK